MMSVLRIGHSPDADDAFMFYAFATGKVTIEGFEIEQVLEDIESLNQRASRGELEVTAISAGAYPKVADNYRIMACGSSVGRNYGPIVISRPGLSADDLGGKEIAIPGEFTTAYLLLRIYLEQPFTPVFLNFDEINEAVRTGRVDAGLIIHEGQITWEAQGYTNLLDLGKVWGEDTGLPIPLGLDMVHRRLGEDMAVKVAEAFEASIRYAITHEDEAVDYALPFGRGIDRDTCRRFVRMYVNEDTINMGDEGRRALEALYQRAYQRGLIPTVPPLDIVGL
jgi:1,4-dihydroxy-6-naphthoate synthase